MEGGMTYPPALIATGPVKGVTSLRLTIRMADIDVNTAFFAREEEKPKFAIPEDCW
jgi:hypothetical protein